jgi:hypothetical protein
LKRHEEGAWRTVLIVGTLLASWLGMQAVHELGHVLGAWLTGGQVRQVVLHPLSISRTDLEANPHPLAVVWAGPILGVAIPGLLWGAAAGLRLRGRFVLRFFAGFCGLANGLYLGLGSFAGVGDCGDLLRHGAPLWQLWLFGAAAAPAGLWLWHGQGGQFGLGPAARPIDRGAALATVAVSVLLVLLGLRMSG